MRAGAFNDLTELIELIGAAIRHHTPLRWVMRSGEHPLNLRMPGMHGTVTAVGAISGQTSSSAWGPFRGGSLTRTRHLRHKASVIPRRYRPS